jgi:hypothetical protein
VPGNARKFSVGEYSLDREDIRVADATSFDADANLTGARFTDGTLDDAKRSRGRDFNCLVCV